MNVRWAAAWRALLVVLLSLFASGCIPNTGADDIELVYEVQRPLTTAEAPPAEPPAPFGQDLRALVIRRLSAGHVSADVYDEGKRVRVVVDQLWASSVDDLLTWTGTVLLYETTDGGQAASLEGTREEIRKAVETTRLSGDLRWFAEPLWDRDTEMAPRRWRIRPVRAAPIGELADGTLVGWGEKGTLRLRAQAQTPAAAVIEAAKGVAREVVVVRGHTSLGVARIEADAALVGFGTGFESYSRAQEQMTLLTTPRLPPLHRAGAVGLPPNNVLAASCIVVPVLLSLAWLVFVRRFDRAHPEPLWLVLVTFLLGALSTFPAAFLEWGASELTPWLDPRLVAFGGRPFALPWSFAVFTIVVGFVEEGSKLGAAMFAARRKEFDEPIDGVVYGIVSSLGFAAAENFQFFAIGRLAAPLVIARAFMSIPAHMFFGAIWGYALGARLVDPKRRLVLWLAASAALHGLFDALLSMEGGGTLALALNTVLASVFVALVRRSLRHGVIDPEARAVKPEDRLLFRVGRPHRFWMSAVALHVLAFGLFMLGAWYQLARHRPSLGFVIGSSVLLLLLAAAAYGVSASLPLDVAVDSYGITFAGAARPWKKIRKSVQKGDHIEVDCEAGPLLLGPAPEAQINAIAAAIKGHLGATPQDRSITLESPFN
jgi:protease PrsW